MTAIDLLHYKSCDTGKLVAWWRGLVEAWRKLGGSDGGREGSVSHANCKGAKLAAGWA